MKKITILLLILCLFGCGQKTNNVDDTDYEKEALKYLSQEQIDTLYNEGMEYVTIAAFAKQGLTYEEIEEQILIEQRNKLERGVQIDENHVRVLRTNKKGEDIYYIYDTRYYDPSMQHGSIKGAYGEYLFIVDDALLKEKGFNPEDYWYNKLKITEFYAEYGGEKYKWSLNFCNNGNYLTVYDTPLGTISCKVDTFMPDSRPIEISREYQNPCVENSWCPFDGYSLVDSSIPSYTPWDYED